MKMWDRLKSVPLSAYNFIGRIKMKRSQLTLTAILFALLLIAGYADKFLAALSA